jgi:hypothetical protein
MTSGNRLIFPDGSKQTTAILAGPAGPEGPAGPAGPPGPGTITGVYPGTYLTGGGSSGSVTIDLDMTKVPTLSANAFAGTQTISHGDLNLPATSGSGVGVINLGGSSFLHSFGSDNTFVGRSASNFSITGSGNSFFGKEAGANNTTGHGNVAIGNGAGYNNTTGKENSFIGSAAGYTNTTGEYNTLVGNAAGYGNNGSSNTFFGYSAGIGTTAPKTQLDIQNGDNSDTSIFLETPGTQ